MAERPPKDSIEAKLAERLEAGLSPTSGPIEAASAIVPFEHGKFGEVLPLSEISDAIMAPNSGSAAATQATVFAAKKFPTCKVLLEQKAKLKENHLPMVVLSVPLLSPSSWIFNQFNEVLQKRRIKILRDSGIERSSSTLGASLELHGDAPIQTTILAKGSWNIPPAATGVLGGAIPNENSIKTQFFLNRICSFNTQMQVLRDASSGQTARGILATFQDKMLNQDAPTTTPNEVGNRTFGESAQMIGFSLIDHIIFSLTAIKFLTEISKAGIPRELYSIEQVYIKFNSPEGLWFDSDRRREGFQVVTYILRSTGSELPKSLTLEEINDFMDNYWINCHNTVCDELNSDPGEIAVIGSVFLKLQKQRNLKYYICPGDKEDSTINGVIQLKDIFSLTYGSPRYIFMAGDSKHSRTLLQLPPETRGKNCWTQGFRINNRGTGEFIGLNNLLLSYTADIIKRHKLSNTLDHIFSQYNSTIRISFDLYINRQGPVDHQFFGFHKDGPKEANVFYITLAFNNSTDPMYCTTFTQGIDSEQSLNLALTPLGTESNSWIGIANTVMIHSTPKPKAATLEEQQLVRQAAHTHSGVRAAIINVVQPKSDVDAFNYMSGARGNVTRSFVRTWFSINPRLSYTDMDQIDGYLIRADRVNKQPLSLTDIKDGPFTEEQAEESMRNNFARYLRKSGVPLLDGGVFDLRQAKSIVRLEFKGIYQQKLRNVLELFRCLKLTNPRAIATIEHFKRFIVEALKENKTKNEIDDDVYKIIAPVAEKGSINERAKLIALFFEKKYNLNSETRTKRGIIYLISFLLACLPDEIDAIKGPLMAVEKTKLIEFIRTRVPQIIPCGEKPFTRVDPNYISGFGSLTFDALNISDDSNQIFKETLEREGTATNIIDKLVSLDPRIICYKIGELMARNQHVEGANHVCLEMITFLREKLNFSRPFKHEAELDDFFKRVFYMEKYRVALPLPPIVLNPLTLDGKPIEDPSWEEVNEQQIKLLQEAIKTLLGWLVSTDDRGASYRLVSSLIEVNVVLHQGQIHFIITHTILTPTTTPPLQIEPFLTTLEQILNTIKASPSTPEGEDHIPRDSKGAYPDGYANRWVIEKIGEIYGQLETLNGRIIGTLNDEYQKFISSETWKGAGNVIMYQIFMLSQLRKMKFCNIESPATGAHEEAIRFINKIKELLFGMAIVFRGGKKRKKSRKKSRKSRKKSRKKKIKRKKTRNLKNRKSIKSK